MRPSFNEQSLKERWSYIDPRIIKGEHASKGQYPWQVFVEIQRVKGNWRCGGTIIDQRWILSAAHCFENKIDDVTGVIVRAGADNLTRRDVEEQRFELGPDQIILHPSYNSTKKTYDYDLALIVLKNDKIKFSDNVQPACLPDDGMLYDLGLRCHISGWGKTGWNEGASSVLLGAEVNLVNDSICAHAYQTKRVQITPNMVCAADLARGIDACQGDSGGPLVCNISGLFYVLGATSFGIKCGATEFPGVYARISAMLPWIKTMQRCMSHDKICNKVKDCPGNEDEHGCVFWPKGTYGLMKTASGCPTGGATWQSGWRNQDTEDQIPSSDYTPGIERYLAGTFSKTYVGTAYCMKTQTHLTDFDVNWPSGTYCILKHGSCPSGFQIGYLFWDDEDDRNINSAGGSLPDGSYTADTSIFYCCRNDGSSYSSITLPTDRPFVLVRYGNTCQAVHGMYVQGLYLNWDTEDTNNQDSSSGMHPFYSHSYSGYTLRFCYYYSY